MSSFVDPVKEIACLDSDLVGCAASISQLRADLVAVFD